MRCGFLGIKGYLLSEEAQLAVADQAPNTRSHGGRPLSVRGAGMALESSRSTESPSCYTKRELAASLMENGSLSLVKLIV